MKAWYGRRASWATARAAQVGGKGPPRRQRWLLKLSATRSASWRRIHTALVATNGQGAAVCRGILTTPTPSFGTALGPELGLLGLSHRAQDRGAILLGSAAVAQHFLCSEQSSICSGSGTSKQRTNRKEAAAPAVCVCVGARVGVCVRVCMYACVRGHGCACAAGQRDRDVPGFGATDFYGQSCSCSPLRWWNPWLSRSLGSPTAVEAVGLSQGRAYRQARRQQHEEARDTCLELETSMQR